MSEKSVFDSKGRIMTFKLITDSTADLDEEWANAHDVEILGLTI
ncbi:DegV family protein [Streptococcus equinus ATCC 9812]|uniref:DegV family protein n=1 Tax=Streptococcus equinus ATCC 9812 TaxID=525379 RepID=E8JR02_STREI|nr:DegV family protein [Streptococcus equinus ATCC 9812]